MALINFNQTMYILNRIRTKQAQYVSQNTAYNTIHVVISVTKSNIYTKSASKSFRQKMSSLSFLRLASNPQKNEHSLALPSLGPPGRSWSTC